MTPAFASTGLKLGCGMVGWAVLSAAAFSPDSVRTKELGARLGLPGDRRYGTWGDMAKAEAARRGAFCGAARMDWHRRRRPSIASP